MKKLSITVHRTGDLVTILGQKVFQPEYKSAGEAEWFIRHVINPWVKSVRDQFNLAEADATVTIKTI